MPLIRDISADRLPALITSTIRGPQLLTVVRRRIENSIGIIDIFAGPGGLGEGFSSFEPNAGYRPFRIGVSAEMEQSAHATLRLRAFYRLLREREGNMPKQYLAYLQAAAAGKALPPESHFADGPLRTLWEEAAQEALNLKLGEPEHNSALYERINEVRQRHERLVLIGGPPCQAYSVVGRARQRNVKGFRTRGDHRHFLYREYLEILSRFTPDVFIMENVKGILSSTVGGRNMFASIREDLMDPGQALGKASSASVASHRYVLLPIHLESGSSRCPERAAGDPKEFVIRCENHGVPQARHRVIIMGVRADHADRALGVAGLHIPDVHPRLTDALSGLPTLRSGLSRRADVPNEWASAMERQKKRVSSALSRGSTSLRNRILSIPVDPALPRGSITYAAEPTGFAAQLWHRDQQVVVNHETRGHMESDLGRYLFCASYAMEHGRCLPLTEFPEVLKPEHANTDSGDFADRFRVQLPNRPSSTITSHLSKDGHAFIHWDASQCRSLTVREAARLQTFSDDYLFLGNRTQQFVQVGNAVPPIIARQIAKVVWSILD
ncbi:DNA cytosine methyltransferase [Dyella thiooxydans]|uniref:DNA cytosine methyltransferase n=1 Tax=Dyella thiooxydans TaxID=445710 RepID=UPI001F02A8D3|nr:DNA (cytosine-5-)-methyltransferase [Dyella thiooxydans]